MLNPATCGTQVSCWIQQRIYSEVDELIRKLLVNLEPMPLLPGFGLILVRAKKTPVGINYFAIFLFVSNFSSLFRSCRTCLDEFRCVRTPNKKLDAFCVSNRHFSAFLPGFRGATSKRTSPADSPQFFALDTPSMRSVRSNFMEKTHVRVWTPMSMLTKRVFFSPAPVFLHVVTKYSISST